MSLIFMFSFMSILFFVIFLLLLPLFAIINLIQSQFKNSNDKIVWLIIILIIPILGSILYFLLSGKQKV